MEPTEGSTMIKIFLDDIRMPSDCLGYMYTRIGKLNPIYASDWVIVRNFDEFCAVVQRAYQKLDTITHISFDHDLGEEHYKDVLLDNYPEKALISFEEAQIDYSKYKEKTGYDCAKWFIDYYMGFGDNPPFRFPMIFVHSMNPVGALNIKKLFE